MKKFLTLLPFLFLAACERQEVKTVVLYHTGDISGFYWARPEQKYKDKDTGGFAVLKNILLREKNPYLLIDSGNWFAGTAEGFLDKGKFAVEVMGRLGYTLSCVGNEEVDAGLNNMFPVFKAAKFPILISNMQESIANTKKSFIKETNGIKFGFFSFIPSTAEFASQRTAIALKDEVENSKEQIAFLKKAGADIIVLVLNTSMDDSKYNESQFVEEVEGIDIILSTSNFDEGEEEGYWKNSTFIAKTNGFLTTVGKMRLNLSQENKITKIFFENLPLFKDNYGEDAEIKALTDTFRKDAHRKLNATITEADEDIKTLQNEPSPLGFMIADCIKTWGKTDIAIVNSNSIRAGIKAGKVTDYSLYEIYPFADTIMSVRFRGEELKNMLESALLSAYNFPQISGLSVEYDPKSSDYKKIKKIKIHGSEVRAETIYRMATTDHIIAGGFGTDDFVNVVEFKNTQVDIRAVLRSCLAKQKKIHAPKNLGWIKQ